MNARDVRNTYIAPRLQELFGNVMASALVTKAIADSIDGQDEKERLSLMVKSICGDPRLVRMLGAVGAKKQMNEWMVHGM